MVKPSLKPSLAPYKFNIDLRNSDDHFLHCATPATQSSFSHSVTTMAVMFDLSAVQEPMSDLLTQQLEEVGVIFERQLASNLTAVNVLCLHIENYRGKMLRPMLVLISGLAASGEPCDGSALTKKHLTVAAVTEMIHMATLVHDDVLDEADTRRRGATVNHLWGNEAAVMLGDYLISNAFHLCSTMQDPHINLKLGEVTNMLCEGELVQIHQRDNFGLDEETYFEIVKRKTASLIGVCCRMGAELTGAPTAIVEALEKYGLALGQAFQIQDDLLDLVGKQEVVGKPLGKDLEKGKTTLPIIYHLMSATPQQRGEVLRLLQQRDIETLREKLARSGAVEQASSVARQLVQQAQETLPELPPSAARDMLYPLADAVVTRTY